MKQTTSNVVYVTIFGYIKFHVDSYLCKLINSKSNKSSCSGRIFCKQTLVHCGTKYVPFTEKIKILKYFASAKRPSTYAKDYTIKR